MNQPHPTPNAATGTRPWRKNPKIRIIPTVAVAVWAASSVYFSLTEAPEILEAMTKLGYPSYTPELIGYAKLAGLVAFIAPVPARLREWAYAGFTFELAAAIISYIAAGHTTDAIAPATIATIVGLSWKLRQQPAITAVAATSADSSGAPLAVRG